MTAVLDPSSLRADDEEPLLAPPADDADGADPSDAADEADDPTGPGPLRSAIALCLPVTAAGILVGGIFTGIAPRPYAVVGGLLGVGLAHRLRDVRRPVLVNLAALGGLAAIGLIFLVPTGASNLFDVTHQVRLAAGAGDVLRPPVPFTPGWHAIVGWAMGLVGFGAGWVALVLRRPAPALLLPIAAAAIAGISLPTDAQVPSGIAALVLFGAGLVVLGQRSEQGVPIGYEIRRAARGLPLLAAIVGLLIGASQLDFLFPKSVIDPADKPQRPKSQPLSKAEDRVLFEVSETQATGPWRLGSLDVYDGTEWRLAATSSRTPKRVPTDGVVEPDLKPGVGATFKIAGLTGVVLPGLANPVGIKAEGPKLSYDGRSGTIRYAEGQLQPGLRYTVVAAATPSVDDLKAAPDTVPTPIQPFLEVPAIPAELSGTIAAAGGSRWERFDALRHEVLDNVVATGTGSPVAVPPGRVADLLVGSKEGSPFEIVAAQALLARWVGVPSRIGYGFDGGEVVGDHREVRPRHGSTFVEVWFDGYGWLPVIGTPKKAKPSAGSDPSQQQAAADIIPSDDLAIQLFEPAYLAPPSLLAHQLLVASLVTAGVLALLALVWVLLPLAIRPIRRSRARRAAIEARPMARVVLAYGEWRDVASDLGVYHPADTPLSFLHRVAGDREHSQLAWLVTRSAWGDLRGQCTPELALAAEELSRALRRRLALAQPGSLRVAAALSRRSLRDPWVAPSVAPGEPETKRNVVRRASALVAARG